MNRSLPLIEKRPRCRKEDEITIDRSGANEPQRLVAILNQPIEPCP
jgi:hypothetical protein